MLSIIPVDTGVETTVELPDALRIESVGSFAARVDDDGIEVVAIGLAGGVPGGLARLVTRRRMDKAGAVLRTRRKAQARCHRR